tara:strand:- start:1613 stop:1915 length:303 start_codon:yes stop_codon:yes gene_type:complete
LIGLNKQNNFKPIQRNTQPNKEMDNVLKNTLYIKLEKNAFGSISVRLFCTAGESEKNCINCALSLKLKVSKKEITDHVIEAAIPMRMNENKVIPCALTVT